MHLGVSVAGVGDGPDEGPLMRGGKYRRELGYFGQG